VKNRVAKTTARIHERQVLTEARLVIANSHRTKMDLLALGVEERKIEVVYLGVSEELDTSKGPEDRCRARLALGLPQEGNIYAFIGALGFDSNKGLDTILRAWSLRLRGPASSDVLAVAGDGDARPWQILAKRLGLGRSVRWLGRLPGARVLLTASDALLAPSRYEAYGLAAQEALASGVPAFVSRRAGIAERYPEALKALLLDDVEDPGAIIRAVETWTRERDAISKALAPLSAELRRNSWRAMCERFVALARSLSG
jgi:glycosyltransferase involved in cell wall biosynthesis